MREFRSDTSYWYQYRSKLTLEIGNILKVKNSLLKMKLEDENMKVKVYYRYKNHLKKLEFDRHLF